MIATIQHNNNSHVIKLEGELDAITAEDARRVFSDVLDSYNKNVVIDMTNVTFIDSSGIGAIVYLYKRLKSNDRDLVITGLSHQPQDIISLLRIDKCIKTYATVNDYPEGG